MISSPKNPKVAAAVRLKKRAFREHERRFLVEGAQAVGEALAAGAAIDAVFATEGDHAEFDRAVAKGIDGFRVSDTLMERLTSTVTPQGLVAVARFLDVAAGSLPDELGCVALLHEVRDPGNAGTVLRSADAAGADAVVFSSSSVDVYNPKTVRASAGSLFHLPIVRGPETAEAVTMLRERGCRVYAMDASGDVDLYDVDLAGPVAFLFGNEAWGLPGDIRALADATVRVPIEPRAESLNLAAAASVCLFEWSRRRRLERRVALEAVIAAAAHDIRSPLTAMKGFAHALATRWETMSDEHRELMLQGIAYDVDRLNSVLRQLVDAAKVAAGALDLLRERTDVGSIVSRIAESLARDPDHPPVVWEGEEIEVLIDPERLQLVVEAFIEAAKWWGSEDEIRVSGALRGDRLVLDVFRRGTSLTPAEAAALFEPRTPGSGAGSKIGLFVANRVAVYQGGTTTAGVDGGLRLTLDIPVTADVPPG